MISVAENARIPVDNPTTHLELTMIHEAMILEYSARHLALIEWAVALEAVHLFGARASPCSCPGASRHRVISPHCRWRCWPWSRSFCSAAPCWPSSKRYSAKVRLFRAPEFLGTAFLLAVLGMLIHFLLEV